jgi:predicted permease
VAVLGAGYWRRMHGADPGIVGRPLRLNGRVFTIVGVAADDFRGSIVGVASDLFVPVVMGPSLTGVGDLEDPDERWLQVFGFPQPGVTLAHAQAEAAVLSARLAVERRDEGDSRRALVVPLARWPYGAQSYLLPGVSVLGATSVLLMFAVCANVMGLVLVRGLARRGELAARLALGATRGRVRRLLLIENLLLAAPAVVIGVWLPRLAEPLLGAAAANMPMPMSFNFDGRLMTAFAIGVAVISTLVYGIAPGIQAARVDVIAVMKAHATPGGRRAGVVRSSLVVVQVAAALLLLVGTGLVLRTLDAAQRTDPGFETRDVSWAALDVRPAGYDAAAARGFYSRLVDALRRDEAIDAASVTELLPLTLVEWQSRGFVPEGFQPTPGESVGGAYNVVGDGYFEAMGIPLAAGREFTARDTLTSPAAVIVNETFARRFWGSAAAAVGRRVDDDGTWRTIVGVARDAKYVRLDEGPRSYFYLPASQSDERGLTVVVRGRAEQLAVLGRIRAIARQIDPRVPVLTDGGLDSQLRVAVGIYDTVARILTAIGLIAVGLAALGVYGIVAYRARQRAHELGIRTAIGATRADILRLVLRQGAALSGAGIALGMAAAVGAAGAMSSVLYGVSAVDVVSFAAAALLLVVVVLVASLLPAWRAARANPVTALRSI